MASAEAAGAIDVEVVYALPAEQNLLRVRVAAGATVEQAIRVSGLLERYPEIDISTLRAGIFGKITALDTPLKAGDRVEMYRPLTVDPKDARRRRAAKRKQHAKR
jgi:uncharacterized protein